MSQEDPIDECLNWFRNGGMLLVADSPNRENEVDFIVSAEHITQDQVTKMVNHGTGIICVTLTEDLAIKNNLHPMTSESTDPKGTAFTVSCDSVDCTTGVSSCDRLKTIHALLHGNPTNKPGHVFPLVAKPGLLFEREGHTEASVALCKLTGLRECAVIVECVNQDGTMMRVSDIPKYKFDCKFCTISTLKEYYTSKYSDLVRNIPNWNIEKCNLAFELSSKQYNGELVGYKNEYTQETQVAVFIPSLDEFLQNQETALTRFHSECCTGNIFGSLHCDCKQQFDSSIELIQSSGFGCVFYILGHEGRGIGLFNKIKAYNVQQTKGLDTYMANTELGFQEESRDYSSVVSICKQMGISVLNIITNNPDKFKAFEHDFKCSIVHTESKVNKFNKYYLETKTKYNKAQMTEQSHKGFNPDVCDVKNKKICIVSTCWNTEYVSKMVNECTKEILESGNTAHCIKVPGSWEIPYTVKSVLRDYDAVIAIGVLIKGETKHFEYIAKNVFNGLMQVQLLDYACPVINGVLTVLNEKQIEERVSLARGWAKSALMMCHVQTDIDRKSDL